MTDKHAGDLGASNAPPTHIIATAGHVDHGKSTLVRTLTGTDPDRWAEEKRRGLTIDLGFGACELPSGRQVSFIDVPGHVRFLKNMLAGVGGIDACLFVVAATEGWKPQSEEHLRILDLLGIEHGVVALTKVGIVDEEWAELAELDVIDHLRGTFLESAPIVRVDALQNAGIPELQMALDACLADTPFSPDRGRPRLWVDRVFSAKGSGTVVTGTLTGGTFNVDDTVSLLGATGRHRSARIRTLQSHGQGCAAVGPGHRVAVNLSGVSHDDVLRGDALVQEGRWHPTTRFDAELQTLAGLDHELSRRGAYAVYLGSGEYSVRLRVLGSEVIAPGERGLVRLHLPVALPLAPGDRFILRDHGRSLTVGGGQVLDVAPVRPASKARPDRSVERIVRERGWVAAEDFDRLTGGARWDGPTVGRFHVPQDVLDQTLSTVRDRVAQAGAAGLDPAQLDERQRLVLDLLTGEGIRVEGGRVVQGEVHDPFRDHPYLAALAQQLFTPPDPVGIDRGELRELVRRGHVIEHDGIYFAAAAIDAASAVIVRLLEEHLDGVTVAQIRDALGATRKHVLPLLAHLDSTGRTRRRGDLRIAGPRLHLQK